MKIRCLVLGGPSHGDQYETEGFAHGMMLGTTQYVFTPPPPQYIEFLGMVMLYAQVNTSLPEIEDLFRRWVSDLMRDSLDAPL